jgi:hypothetical protein
MGWPHPSILLAALTAVDVSPSKDSAAPSESLSVIDLVNGADLLQSAVSDDTQWCMFELPCNLANSRWSASGGYPRAHPSQSPQNKCPCARSDVLVGHEAYELSINLKS